MEKDDYYSKKDVDYIIVNDKEKQEKIIYLLFQGMWFLKQRSSNPLEMLRDFQFSDGTNMCGFEGMDCLLSDYFEPNEVGYFGEDNVFIYDGYTDEGFVMSENDFYPYIEKYSNIYMEYNPDKKEEVLSCLKNIKKRFKIE